MTILIERDGPVTTIVLNRPERRNAIDGPMGQALAAAVRDFEADDDARVAVIWGAGGCFCAGADLKALATGVGRPRNDPEGDGPLGPTRAEVAKPMIAAVSGHAVAGGLELALMCDLRIVEEDAIFGVFCRRWGVPLIDGGTVRLPRLVGMGRALDLILTGRAVGAEEAREMGLATKVVPRSCSRGSAEQLAREIARFPQACMLVDRASAWRQWDLPMRQALVQEARSADPVRNSGAFEGAKRFASGRGRHGNFESI